MTMQPSGGSAVERKEASSLADVVSTILDKGVVVDIFARVSLVGIELVRIDARVVIASVDTYLRFAEAVNRLELGTQEPDQLSDVVGGITESGAKKATSRVAKGKAESFIDKLLPPSDTKGKKARRRR